MKVRQGQTTERDTKRAAARVGFDALKGAVTRKLQVLFPAVGGWNIFYTPKVDDHTVTLLDEDGEGYVLAKVYTANKMPQGGADDIFLMVSDDGKNVIRLDAANGTLDVVVDQGGCLKFKNLDVEVKLKSNHKADDVDIESAKPMGIEGTKTLLGAVLQKFCDDVEAAFNFYTFIPPIEWPAPVVPPSPPLENMASNGVKRRMLQAIATLRVGLKKVLKD
jgi:Holliday junction resolvase